MPDRPPWWPEGEPWPPGRRFSPWWLLVPIAFFGVCSAFAIPYAERHRFPWFLIPLFFFAVFLIRRRRSPWFPVRNLVNATKQLSEGDYSVRVSGGQGGPMREVVVAFNEMARRLETASTQRRQLLADLGHELRNPLTVLQGEIEAILDGVHPPNREQLDRLLEETKVMSRLLDDLRTLSLSESGELELEREEVQIADLLDEAVAGFSRTAEERGVRIDVAAEPSLIAVDRVRIREVLSNLASNALRHSQSGQVVTVEGTLEGDRYRIRLIDQGPGIPEEVLPRVFDRFVKGSDSTGSGLGLSIARDLVRAHGGELVATNLPQGGTELSFSLPTYAPPGGRA